MEEEKLTFFLIIKFFQSYFLKLYRMQFSNFNCFYLGETLLIIEFFNFVHTSTVSINEKKLCTFSPDVFRSASRDICVLIIATATEIARVENLEIGSKQMSASRP